MSAKANFSPSSQARPSHVTRKLDEVIQNLQRKSAQKREDDARRAVEFEARVMREGIANANALLLAAIEHVKRIGRAELSSCPELIAAFMTAAAINRAATLVAAEIENVADATRGE
jgi:uncharacterized protein (DUF2267 family)